MNVDRFLEAVTSWAETQPGLAGVVLVGSHARGTASASSDIDVVLLADDPGAYLRDRSWLSLFGEPIQHVTEDWGAVTSVRVFYGDGREVEFGLAGTEWGCDPTDEGALKVIRDGVRVLYDRGLRLSARIDAACGRGAGDAEAG